jgi:hypothetical protein
LFVVAHGLGVEGLDLRAVYLGDRGIGLVFLKCRVGFRLQLHSWFVVNLLHAFGQRVESRRTKVLSRLWTSRGQVGAGWITCTSFECVVQAISCDVSGWSRGACACAGSSRAVMDNSLRFRN